MGEKTGLQTFQEIYDVSSRLFHGRKENFCRTDTMVRPTLSCDSFLDAIR